MEILPKYIQERIPRGEKDFREALNRQLSDSPTIVLHSVGSTEHLRKSYTEVDFVLITDQGIACLRLREKSLGAKTAIGKLGIRIPIIIMFPTKVHLNNQCLQSLPFCKN